MSHQPYPVHDSRKEIVFVRHAESQANREGIWNGRTDGELSEAGEASLDELGRRLSSWRFDAVISSPLGRARKTAEAFADEVTVDDAFTEVDLGEWEGLPFADVQSRHGEELSRALTDKDVPMGRRGESLAQLAQRAITAVDELFDRMSEGQRVAVVTHGGFMQPVLKRQMPSDGSRVHAFTSNTAITTVVQQFGHPRLANFNDTGHLGPRSTLVDEHLAAGDPVLALIRHGRTLANVEGRWQGHGDWDLDEVGRRQAEALGEWYGRHGSVYTSPLRRAVSTAQQVAANGIVPVDGLKEIDMGEWEGLTTPEIEDGWADIMETIYVRGVDLPRGNTGESWAQLTRRISSAMAGLGHSEDGPTLAVAHGGAIRSYISSLTRTTDTHSESLLTPANTSVSHIALTQNGPEILDFSVSMHLESLQYSEGEL